MSPQAPDRARDRAEILAHIDSIFKALAVRDQEALRRTHLPEFSGFTVRSRSVIQNREQYMQEMAGALESQPITAYKMLESDIDFYGDTAIVSYIALVGGTGGRGDRFEYKMRVMDVYVRTPEGWNLAGTSVSMHPDEIDRHLSAAAASSRK